MAIAAYKPNQGTYARGGAAAALLLLDLLASYRLFQVVASPDRTFSFFGLPLPTGLIWAVALFVVLGLGAALLTVGVRTGLGAVDGKTQGFIDLLIDTQGELQKVSWPDRDDVTRSSAVVLVSIVVLGVFLLGMDFVISWVVQFLLSITK